MSIFSKKEKVKLEDIIPVMVMTAFEYPTIKNIQAVDGEDKSLTKNDYSALEGEVPIFIIAINYALLTFSAEQGKIPRFKGETSYKVGEALGFNFGLSIGRYLQEKMDVSKNKSADIAEKMGNESLAYITAASERAGNKPLIKDVFFELCREFQNHIIGKFDESKLDRSATVFDFAVQLYRNIEDSFILLRIE